MDPLITFYFLFLLGIGAVAAVVGVWCAVAEILDSHR